jgi:hypothetical protein
MGKLYIEKGKRWLDFSPRENSYGKNPGAFEILEVPNPISDTYLGDVIAQIKSNINQLAVVQKDEADFLGEWQIALEDMSTVDELNHMLPEAIQAGIAVKMLLHKKAVQMGFTFNKKAGVYEPKPVPVGS